MGRLNRRAFFGGSNLILSLGVILVGLSASVLAVDLPYYFAAQNQLRTAVDAAALAGAAKLPDGEADAEEAALEMAAENPITGKPLQPEEMTFTSEQSKFTVSASTKVPTIIGKFLCALSGKTGGMDIEGAEGVDNEGNSGNASGEHCNSMTVAAASSAAPAARDTILVIDTSNSMDDLGNGRPMKDIKTAANNFVDTIVSLDSSYVDRIGLVSFDQTGKKQLGLTAQTASPGFVTVKDKITNLKLFSGIGWNTNYEAGLKLAVDELEQNGRKNAHKIIIFMTDGIPNLPAPTSPVNYYSYDSDEPYRKCIDPVNNSSAVKAKCYKSGGKTVCPVLPSATITNAMIPSSAVQCAQTYVDAMSTKTNAQTDRAKNLDVTIYTISLYDPNSTGNSEAILRRLLKDSDWRPPLIDYMVATTQGESYEAPNYNAGLINEIYQTIAKDIHIKLVNN